MIILTFNEKCIYDDITSVIGINESKGVSGSTFKKIKDKLSSYVKKGLVTGAIVTSVLAVPGLSNAQQTELKQMTKIEQGVEKGVGAIKGVFKKKDGYKIGKENVDKKIEFSDGKTISSDEFKMVMNDREPGTLEKGLIVFFTAETGPKGTSTDGKDYKIVVTKTPSSTQPAGLSMAREKVGQFSKDPSFATQIITLKKDGKYFTYTFTKVPL